MPTPKIPSQTPVGETPGSVEPHLRVYDNRSVLYLPGGREEVFLEGPPSPEARERWDRIQKRLEGGWLENDVLPKVRSPDFQVTLSADHGKWLEGIADAVSSEVGRALLGVTLGQLVVKALESGQSVRLHKGGRGEFSWEQGISLRTLTAALVPFLGRHGLVRGNIFGPMMTRSMAENYPYSRFYKAAIRGAKDEWVAVTDALEEGSLEPLSGLVFLISILFNRSERFEELANKAMAQVDRVSGLSPTPAGVLGLIKTHIELSDYSSRLLEVAMHSLVQVAAECGKLDGELRPLCQMRTANKKHRNVGDIEITAPGGGPVIEAWDSKYGRPYLRDELEELDEKLTSNPSVEVAGFVTDQDPEIDEPITTRLAELSEAHEADIEIVSFDQWVTRWIRRIDLDPGDLASAWLNAYAGSLSQKRREVAPIDEPSDAWVAGLLELLSKLL